MSKLKIKTLNLFTYASGLPGRLKAFLEATTVFNFPQRLLRAGKAQNLPVAIHYGSAPNGANLYKASAEILNQNVDFILLSGKSLEEISRADIRVIFNEFKIENQIFSNFVTNIPVFISTKLLGDEKKGFPIIQPPLSPYSIPSIKTERIIFKPIPKDYEPDGKLGAKTGSLKEAEIAYKNWLQKELLIITHRPKGYSIDTFVKYCETIANRLIRAYQGELDLLVAQNILSEDDFVYLQERNRNLNVKALSLRITQMLQEYLDNNLSRPQIEILIRKLSPLVRPESLAEQFGVSLSLAVTAIWASKNPTEYLKKSQKV
ncbi:MAG: hypothetical protein V3T21_02610 [Candidatus Margulisiibacteriota bacterium]